MKRITVIGATGMLGAPVTQALADSGFSVTAMVRDLQKAKQKLPDSVQLIEGRLEHLSTITEAVKEADFIYLSLSTSPNERRKDFKTEIHGVQNVIEAAKASRIKRIGYLSSIIKDADYPDWWMFDLKREACEILKHSPIPATIFKPSNFYEDLTDLMMVGSNILLVGRQQTKSYWISAHEYGKMAAKSFELDTDDQNYEYIIQGPQPLNFDEAADIFIQHYSPKKLHKLRIPVWFLKAAGTFSSQADFAWRINEAINTYDEHFEGKAAWDKLGKPSITIDEFAKKAG